MKQEISAWVDKAEDDWQIMHRESRFTEKSSLNAVCFHAQQCIEKYLKARLILANITFRKTHDLLILYEDIVLIEPNWSFMHDGLGDVSTYAVALRYPGLDATEQEAKRAFDFCGLIRKIVRNSLNLADA